MNRRNFFGLAAAAAAMPVVAKAAIEAVPAADFPPGQVKLGDSGIATLRCQQTTFGYNTAFGYTAPVRRMGE